ncbi:YggS family pyridoxal phosphate-dependent enzyme [candidate division KSB1 bacterium]|nr:YggS family pyridoxal phosphate-dependent enzyme [candidate division KSB1 bacterium]
MRTTQIKETVKTCLSSLPPGVDLVAAAKTRTPEEINAAVEAGVRIIGYNYLQEAERMFTHVGSSVQWHMIGHLQSNKAKRAARLFDMIETIDSLKIAFEVNRHCADMNKIMPVLIEINSGEESNKTGVLPDKVDDLVREIGTFSHIRVQGLMTMGPRFGDPGEARPYFRATKAAFDRLYEANIPDVEMRFMSMGMRNSYEIAIEEGANIVRIGTYLFGERHK